ncbi:F-box protein SKIP22 [Forsythia ovata]|uniref:F-box protein SKIP22 n=1 Tax=Forsythia ovata TaxID=205694 RepID=A0ABD1TL87_9LAMI
MIQKEDVFSRRFARKQVIEFRKTVKDKLALPLLYELCEKAGVGLPSRFMQLPSDLKLKIFESLPGVDVARLSCVCLELKDLGSSEDLWKLKFTEESGDRLSQNWSWRRTFALFWQDQKKKRATQNRIQPPWHCRIYS